MATAAGLRPKITRLTQAELSQAEAAVEMLKGSGLSLFDAVRHALRTDGHGVETVNVGGRRISR